MPSGNVDVRIHDTDEVTWATLVKVFPVSTADTATWIAFVDAETGIRLTFFKARDNDPDHFEGNLGANIAGDYEPELDTEASA